MNELAYDFMFFRFTRPADADAWSIFAIDQIECHGDAPSLIGGKKSGWVKAPKDRATLIQKIAASNNRSIQGGKNPRSDDPIDGWGIYASATDFGANLCRYRESPGHLHDWMASVARKLADISEISHGFGYSGRSPKDVFFGMGMSAGKPSAELAPIFSDEEKVARWFRACMWNTDVGYIRDAFPVNILSNVFLETALPGMEMTKVLAKYGGLTQVENELHLWSIETEENRSKASSFLAEHHLSVSSHPYGSYSQLKGNTSRP